MITGVTKMEKKNPLWCASLLLYDTVQFITYSKFENLPIIICNKCNQIKLKNRGKKNATPRTNVEKCESADQLYLASILQIWFPTITNSILL